MRKKLFVLELFPEWFQSGTSMPFWRADAIGGFGYEQAKGFITYVECILGEPVKKLLRDLRFNLLEKVWVSHSAGQTV